MTTAAQRSPPGGGDAPLSADADVGRLPAPSAGTGRAGLGIGLGLLENGTYASRVRVDDERIPNSYHQYLESWETDVLVSYPLTDRFGVRAYLPFLYRQWRRENPLVGIESGDAYGIGDVSVEATWVPVRRATASTVRVLTLFIGLETPTGDDSYLAEEREIRDLLGSGHSHGGGDPNTPPHAIHGHDISPGSGSWDPTAGASAYLRSGRWFATAHGQYVYHTQGPFGFRYGDALMWGGGPGWSFVRSAAGNAGIQLMVSGDWCAHDHLDGTAVGYSGGTNLYLGPDLSASWRGLLSAEAGLDLPVWQHESGLQAIPDWRVHAGLSWSF